MCSKVEFQCSIYQNKECCLLYFFSSFFKLFWSLFYCSALIYFVVVQGHQQPDRLQTMLTEPLNVYDSKEFIGMARAKRREQWKKSEKKKVYFIPEKDLFHRPREREKERDLEAKRRISLHSPTWSLSLKINQSSNFVQFLKSWTTRRILSQLLETQDQEIGAFYEVQ